MARRCGDPDKHFARYGYTFGNWIDAAPGAGLPAFLEVEAGVADYLRVAAQTGRRLGTFAGLAVGGAAAPIVFLVVCVVA